MNENKLKISLTIEKDLYERYKKYCANKGYKYSTRIAVLIKQELEKESRGKTE